ncbi:MAG: cytochrome c biogenesis protein CcsA [Fibrobacter sp.]|nr:cytochrome c biogenesis protein CcsA [Fibrobacter sp.]
MIFRVAVLLLMAMLNAFAFENSAESFPEFVDFNGRYRPLNSMENEVTNALCEKKKCVGLRPAALVQRIRNGSADSAPVFRINRATTVDILHLDPERRTFMRKEFEPTRSLLKQYAEREDSRPLTQELIRLNYALDLYDSIQSDNFWQKISVEREDVVPQRLRQLVAERAYLRWNLPFVSWILTCIAFALSLLALWKKNVFWKSAWVTQSLVTLCFAGIFIWRAVVGNHLPLTSLYEMILVLVLGISFLGVVVSVKFGLQAFLAFASGMCLVLSLVMRSALSGDSFAVAPMQLMNSPFWLSLHVFTIASGFCVLILSSLLAHVMLFSRVLKKKLPMETQKLLFSMLGIGFAISALGTLLGGFWADVAWGRFWGWDPKENAALLVLLWVLIVMHLKAGNFVSHKTLEVLSALLSVVIAFCLFGVNLLGVGLHSYGYSPRLLVAFLTFVICDVGIISVLGFFSRNQK